MLSQRAYSKSPALDDHRKAEAPASNPRNGRSASHGASDGPDRTPPKRQDSSSTPADTPQEQRRGRSRFQTAQDAAAAAKAARKRPGKSEQRSRSAQSSQPIDLSQFQVIEEYTCEHCPVHGSRSNSRAKDKSNGTPAASSQPRFRSGSAREHRSNMPTSNMNATPQKMQTGVRKMSNLAYPVIDSDVSGPDPLIPPRSAPGAPRRHHGSGTAPPRHAQKQGLGDGPVRIHLHMEGKKIDEPRGPVRPPSSSLLPARSTPNLDLSTPTAIFVVYDPSELDAESCSLLSKKLRCVVKSPWSRRPWRWRP